MADVKSYRCRHAVEALRWEDTDASRETFAAWFEKHGAVFETRGSEITLPEPETGTASKGEWIVFSDGEFLAMEDEMFVDVYEEIPS